MEKMSVFGSSGFIGGNFCKKFPNEVIKIERSSRNPITNNILYFISSVSNYSIHTNITIDVESNLKVLCETLDFCRSEDFVFNFVSSWFVYGVGFESPLKEDHVCNPKGFYSITKKCAEDLLISFCETYGVKYRILRLCNVLGKENCKTSEKKNAIVWMIENLKKENDVNLYGNGEEIRDILHVDDICDAIKLICEKGDLNQIYNVGSGKPTKISEIIYLAKKILNSNSSIKEIDSPEFYKKFHEEKFWMDCSKLKSLGFYPKISIEKIVKELCN